MNTPGFAAGTQVATSLDASGHLTTQNIQDVQVGDRVLTRNQNDPNAPIEQRQVTAVSVHTVDHLRLLDIKRPTARPRRSAPPMSTPSGWRDSGGSRR